MAWFGDTSIGRIGRFFGNDPSLVGYWQLDKDLNDRTLNGHNLTAQGSYASANPVYGKSGSPFLNAGFASLSAAVNNAYVMNNMGIDGAAITMMTWVVFAAAPSAQSYFFTCTSAGTQTAYEIEWYSGSWYFRREKSAVGSADVVATANIEPGVPYLLTLVYDTSSIYGYVNGRFVGSTAGSGNGTGSNESNITVIGGDYYAGSFASYPNAQCQLSETAIFNRAIPAPLIAQYYAWAIAQKTKTAWKQAFQGGIVYTLTAVQGAYTLTGEAITNIWNRLMAAVQGAYTLTGEAATLVITRGIAAVTGIYTLVGEAVTMRIKAWTFRTKNNATWTERSKNNATWSTRAKNAASWIFRSKD